MKNKASSQGGGDVCTPCTLPLDPPLVLYCYVSVKSKLKYPLCIEESQKSKIIKYGHLIKILGVGEFETDLCRLGHLDGFSPWEGEYKHPITEKFKCRGRMINNLTATLK